MGIKAHAGNEAARNGQRLLVDHRRPFRLARARSARWISVPQPRSSTKNSIMFDWYDYLFQGKQNRYATDKPVRIFVMGENKWRDGG